MKRSVGYALRRALAALVLFGFGVAVVAVLDYRENTGNLAVSVIGGSVKAPPPKLELPSSFYLYARPWWAIPVAIVVGLLGPVLSALIYRPRIGWSSEFPRHRRLRFGGPGSRAPLA